MTLMIRIVIIVFLSTLSACGFEPVYGDGGTGMSLQNQVLVDRPIDRERYILVRRIEERLGRAADPSYLLSVDLSVSQEDSGIDPEGDIRRFQLIGSATYTLKDTRAGAIITTGTVDNFVGSSATGTTVATFASRRDAEERLMIMLADQIVLQLQMSSL